MNKPLTYDQVANRDTQRLFIEKHANLVKRIAHHLAGRLPPNVLIDDLIQSGMIGLLEAQQNFDSTKGASFETYAGIRIRGSMLDEMRRGDWVPRSVHKNSRLVSGAIRELEAKLSRDPTDKEIAKHLEMNLDQYHQILNDVSCGRLVGIEDLGVSEDTITTAEMSSQNLPFQGVAEGNFKDSLVAAIKTLPEREALVLSLYYDEELNLKEIGAVLGVSESRVCQILSQSTQRLRSKLTAWTADN